MSNDSTPPTPAPHEAATPRTDAEAFEVWTREYGNIEVTNADFARTLERVTLQLIAEWDKWKRQYEEKEKPALILGQEIQRLTTELTAAKAERDEAKRQLEQRTREAIGEEFINDNYRLSETAANLRAQLAQGEATIQELKNQLQKLQS